MLTDDKLEDNIGGLLSEEDLSYIDLAKNQATRLIDLQSGELKEIRKKDDIDDFRHMVLQKLLTQFYTHQGKCERIKKYHLPRQYAATSMMLLLPPFSMMPEFNKLGGILSG